MWIILTIAAAVLGGTLLKKLRVPAGLLLGAAIAVAALNVLTGKASIWPHTRVFSQIVGGLYLGGMMTKNDLRRLPRIVKPYLTIMLGFFGLNIIVALILFFLTDLSLITCFLSAMPGGISDSPLIAMDMGADVPTVTVLQFIRVLFGLACLPPIIGRSDGRGGDRGNGAAAPAPARAAKGRDGARAALIPYLPTFFVGAAAGLVGSVSGIAAGTLSASMAAAAAMSASGKARPMPDWLRAIAQLLCGCCIGVTVHAEQLRQLPGLFGPALICCAGYLLLCVGMGRVVSRRFGFERKEAMLCLAPAGAVEMTFIAEDMGVESPNLGIIQMFRLVGVILVFPQIFHIIVHAI